MASGGAPDWVGAWVLVEALVLVEAWVLVGAWALGEVSVRVGAWARRAAAGWDRSAEEAGWEAPVESGEGWDRWLGGLGYSCLAPTPSEGLLTRHQDRPMSNVGPVG